MPNDPYAAPSADLVDTGSTSTIPTSIWTGKGRLSVASFFGQVFVLMLVFGVVAVALVGMTSLQGGDLLNDLGDSSNVNFSNPGMIVVVIAGLVWEYIIICMTIKRLHDLDHSGWWAAAILIGSLIPIVNFVVIIGMIYVSFFPGTKTDNRFGGRRETKGWEKVCAILYLVIIIALIGAAVLMASGIVG